MHWGKVTIGLHCGIALAHVQATRLLLVARPSRGALALFAAVLGVR
jgi:hypothetical protein